MDSVQRLLTSRWLFVPILALAFAAHCLGDGYQPLVGLCGGLSIGTFLNNSRWMWSFIGLAAGVFFALLL